MRTRGRSGRSLTCLGASPASWCGKSRTAPRCPDDSAAATAAGSADALECGRRTATSARRLHGAEVQLFASMHQGHTRGPMDPFVSKTKQQVMGHQQESRTQYAAVACRPASALLQQQAGKLSTGLSTSRKRGAHPPLHPRAAGNTCTAPPTLHRASRPVRHTPLLLPAGARAPARWALRGEVKYTAEPRSR